MPIFVNANRYVSKSCAAIFGEFLKSSEMAAHNLDAYIHSVYINIVPHKALISVLISKSLAELAAEGS